MREEREAFSKRLADAMRDAGYEPRPSVLFKLFNSRYRGKSVSFQTASRWLNGRSIPEQDKLRVLAREFGVELHALMFGASNERVAESHPTWRDGLKLQDIETLDAYLALPASRRKLVRELIAQLANPSVR